MAYLILPAGLLVVLLLVIPMAVMARISLNEYDPLAMMVEALTPGNYLQALADPYYREVLLTTLGVSLICTILTLIIAFPVAYWLARMESKWKSAITIVVIFPLLIGSVVRSAGWVALLGSSGFINASLMWAGLIDSPITMLYTRGAVIVGIVGVVLPYMILILAAVIESIHRQTEEAAANLGAKPLVVFYRIILPLASPGLIAGSALVFILCMNAYSTPVLLGGPELQMMAPAVYDQFTRVSNWPLGAALAFILLFVTLVLTVVGSSLIGRKYQTAQR